MPRGTLRESKRGSKRADSIIITKCPSNFSDSDKNAVKKLIKLSSEQNIFFSSIKYSDNLFSNNNSISISKLTSNKVNLVTGIVNSIPLIAFLKNKGLEINHFKYPDHHNYSEKDIIDFKGEIVITTEKDYTKLRKYNIDDLYYLPISVDILEKEKFLENIKNKIS